MASTAEFTVVMPVYNGEKYIAASLDSVLAQTYRPAQIIVIDDGSSDDTARIVEGYGAKVQLVRQTNQGQSAARNRGVSLAKTEWISFSDQDDLWLSHHLEEQARAIGQQPDADLCYAGRCELVHDRTSGEPRLGNPVLLPRADQLATVLLDHCPFQPASTSVRRSALLKVGGWDSSFDSVEDWNLWLRLVQNRSQAVYSSTPTMHYRIHPGAATNRPLKVLAKGKRLVKETIAPMLPRSRRQEHCQRVISRLEAETAILLRENGSTGASRLMLKSIARHPLHGFRRYKIALHMLLFGARKAA